MTSILVYARPWNRDQFEDLAKTIWPECRTLLVSEHRSIDQNGLSDLFYRALSAYQENAEIPGLSEASVTDVILRCRLLRGLAPATARRYVFSMNRAIDDLLDRQQPIAALSVTVDSYLIHLIYLACKRHSIPFIGLVPTFVNGYFRVTALGERTWSRRVGRDEIDHVYQMLLSPSYKPNFLAKSPDSVRKTALRNWIRNIPKPLWFRVRRWISGDVLNYHYYATQTISQKHWTILPQGYAGKRPSQRSDLTGETPEKPLVFLPLQMSPEATIDYWSADTCWIDYENRVLALLDEHLDNLLFAVKEHPNVLGNRTQGFYQRLKLRKNCILIAPETSSNALIDMSDAVVICTGSVGFEAALRGIPVFSDSSPFHLRPSHIRPISELTVFDHGEIERNKLNPPEYYGTIEYLLEGLLPGIFINNGTWLKSKPEHRQLNRIMSSQISKYFSIGFPS